MTVKKGFTHESTHNESVEWYTPYPIFDALGIEFDLDPCSPGAKICPWIPAKKHLTVKENGLMTQWRGNVWLNPPYNKETSLWLDKLALHGQGIALLFARTDTKWFHKYATQTDALCFIKGRIQFVPADDALDYVWDDYKRRDNCAAPSVLMAFGEDNASALFESKLGLTVPVSKLT